MKRLIAATLLAIGCSRTEPSGDSGALPGAMAAQDCCDYVISNAGNTMATKYLSCCLAMLATVCHPNPSPKPPAPDAGSGGSVSTGGRASVGGNSATGGLSATGGASSVADGKALCISATLASPARKAEANDNGMTVSALAQSLCSYQTVQDCFARGVCK